MSEQFPHLPGAEFPNDNSELHAGAVWVCLSPTGSPRAVTEATGLRPEAYLLPPVTGVAPALPILGTPVFTAPVGRKTRRASVAAVQSTDPGADLASAANAPAGPESFDESADDSFVRELAELVAPLQDELNDDRQREALPVVETPVVAAGLEPTHGYAKFLSIVAALAHERGGEAAGQLVHLLLSGATLPPSTISAPILARLGASRILLTERDVVQPEPGFQATAQSWRQVLDGESHELEACGELTLDAWAAELLKAVVGNAEPGLFQRELRRRGVAAFGLLSVG